MNDTKCLAAAACASVLGIRQGKEVQGVTPPAKAMLKLWGLSAAGGIRGVRGDS